jgi:hypothetical protein
LLLRKEQESQREKEKHHQEQADTKDNKSNGDSE